MNIPSGNLPRVVIIGGGFAGLELAKHLANAPFQVVVLDRHNYHTFQPLLYQVATAGLEPDSIAYPLRKIFRKRKNIFFRLAEVQHILHGEKLIRTNIGDLSFDYLVIASGSRTNFFGNAEIEHNAMPMKTIPQALNIRSLLLQNFEDALNTKDLDERLALMSVVIVGGGPTGVELAGALAELKAHVLPSDYPDLDVRQMEIHLIEGSEQLLAAMGPESGAKSREFLEEMGVQCWLNTRVTSYDGERVNTANNKQIRSKNLIWAAGVKGNHIPGIPEESLQRNGRIRVDEFNQVSACPNVFAMGDVAAVQGEANSEHPMLAQVAIQQGKNLARNLVRLQKGQALNAFRYKDPGTMATIGRNRAVVELPRYSTQGFFAWFIWMGVHILTLVGFRNKLVVLANWIYNYFRYARDIRLIIRPYKRVKQEEISVVKELKES